MELTRRTVVGGLAAATALAAPTVLRAQTRELVMVGYGNEQDQPLIKAGEELGRRHAGVTLRVIGGLSAEALAQIKAARGNSPYDLAVMGSPAIINAVAEDVLVAAGLQPDPERGQHRPALPALRLRRRLPDRLRGHRHRLQQADGAEPARDLGGGLEAPSSAVGRHVPAAVEPRPRRARRDAAPPSDTPRATWSSPLRSGRSSKPLVGRSPPLLQQMIERGEIDLRAALAPQCRARRGGGLPIGYVKIAKPGPMMLPTNIVHFVNTADGTRELVHEFADILLTPELQQHRRRSRPDLFRHRREGDRAARGGEALPALDARGDRASTTSLDWPNIAPIRGQIVEAFDRMFAS